MSNGRSARRKNIGFKPEGADPAHDAVYAVLDSLPRGSVCDLVVLAVTEFLQNHAGETVSGKQRRKYVILGTGGAPDSVAVRGGERTASGGEAEGDARRSAQSARKETAISLAGAVWPLKEAKHFDECSTLAEEEDAKKRAYRGSGDAPPVCGGEADAPPVQQTQPSYTELDDETLDSLVLGFGSPQE